MMSSNEILDIVCPHDIAIGQKPRSLIYVEDLSCFRMINGFIYNSDKKFFISHKHPKKQLMSLCLGASVVRHVSADESYKQVFARQTQEELNIDITQVSHKRIARLTPQIDNASAFMWVYMIYSDILPNYDKQDFIEHYWLSLDEFDARMSQGDKAKSDLPIILNSLRNLL